jgi:dihydrofolate reductase
MRRLIVFNHVSLDGYFTDVKGGMDFARHAKPDAEWDAFAAGNASEASGGGMFVFGRITYEMMAAFWPTPMAAESMPVVARTMNARPKIVFSRTLDKADWNNTRLVKEDLPGEIRRLKQTAGDDMLIFGSGIIIAQLAQQDLIDEYQIVVNPVVLGAGRSMFDGIKKKLPLRLTKTRPFANGNVLLCYQLEANGQ